MKNSVRNLFSNQIALALKLLLGTAFAVAISACSMEAKLFEGASLGISSISGKLVGYSSASSFSIQSSGTDCTAPTARLYKMTVAGELAQPALETSVVDNEGTFKFSSQASGLVDYSGTTLVVEVRGCDSSIYYRPVTGGANQDVTMASSLLGFILNTNQKNALFKAMNTNPQSLAALMTVLSSATDMQKAYDILVASSDASDRFTNLFGFSAETLLNAAPVVLSSSLPTAAQEKISVNMNAQAVHWSSSYNIIYQWALDGRVIGTTSNLDYVASGDSQGHHTLTLTVGRNDGSGGVDLTRETYILTSQIEIANNVLPQPPTFMITAPSVSNGLPINTRALTVTLNTGASKANCDTFKNLLLNENPTVPTGESFPITCTQNNSQALSYTLTSAGDGTKALYLWAQDSAGVISQMPTTLNFTLDTTAPTVSITTQPLAQSRLNSQSFAFAGDDGVGAIDHFECKMDSGAWALCSSPVAYTGLVEGDHTVYVRAVDPAGNTSVPDSKVWHIDLTAPVLLLAGPNSLTNSLSASFTLSATDSGGSGVASYQCSVDGGAYAACTAISSYVLAAGSHTFKARAYDGAGNVSAVQTFSWTIDTTPPTTTLTSKPSALTNALTATFGFVGSDTGGGNIAGFECSLDGASYGACTTGKSYSALADGVHTFQVRATDTAGNIGNAATYSWTVDSSTPMASLSLYPDSITNETSATFAFSATAPAGGSITGYQCQINGSAWTSCTSPKNYTSFVQGTQTFGVRSIDNNSNISTPTTYTWVVDTTAPTLTITDKPNALTNLSTAQFKFDGVDTGGGSIDSFYCQLDGAAFTQCSSPRDLSGLTQGTHTFNVKVTDTAGNTSAVSSYSWVVDLTAPTMTLLTTPDLLTNATTAAFTFSSVDSGGGSLAGSYCSLDGSTPDSCVSGVSYSSLAGGVHTFEVHSVDTAGNSSSTASYTWTIDVTPPVVTLTSKPLANWNSAAATFAFVGSDNGGGSVAGYQCKLDSGSYAACTSGVTFTSLSDGVHTFAVYATDTAGNQSALVSYSWTTDTVTPVVAITSPSASGTVVPVGSLGSYVISGTCSENGSVVNIAGLSVTPASCSGGTWSATLNLTSLVDATYTLSASQTDAAGNVGSSASKTIIKDATAPTITLTTPVATRGGAALGINWVATEANVATSTSFSIELYDGSAWSSFGTAAATAGTNAAKAYSLSTVNVPSLDTASARVRVTLTDAAGNSTTVTSGTFVVDSSAPVLSTFTLNDGLASTANNNVRVGFAANDSLTNIAKICMMTSNTAPTSASSCWVTVSSYGLTASKNLSTSNIYFNVGLVSGTFPVYIWLMDAVGNISVNHAALGVDRGSVVYNSPTPPIVNAIQLTATDAPANPPSGNDLKATSGSPIYLKWNISSSAGLSASPIKVVYMTDDATEAGAVASGLTNAANGSCTVTAGFTGCAVVNAPVGTYFRLKLKVTDALGFTTSITSNPLNSGSINFLAGNTDLGLGASAKSAILQPSGTNSLAVLDDGRIFLIDSRGLAWVNPTTGVYEIIATTAASSSGDGGVLTSAKFKSLGGLWVDNNNDILVADATIIRKINTRVSPMTISRYLGGGSDSSDYVTGATNFLATSNISHITVSSNGDLFFRSSSDRKVRKYTVSTGVVSTINLSGTGNRYSATQDNTLCTTNNYFTTFDANGNVDKLVWYMQIGVSTSCPFSTGTSEGRAMAVVDPTTGVSFLPAPAYIKSTNGSRDYANFYNDKSGNVYAAYGTTGSAVQAIYKFDSTNLTWTLTYGSNQPGTCPDGTSQASCAISASALTFNSQGQLFYVDTKSKSIRTVDSEGKIRTLVGDRLGSDDGRQVLATRFGSLTDVKSWNSNGQSYITVMDFNDVRVREFQPGETIYTLVGMQYSAVPAVGSVAAENPFANTADSYPNRIMVSEAGDLYLSRAGGTMSRVPRATGLWEDLSNGYGYGPALIAINSQKLLVNTFSWTLANGAQDSRFVTYDLTAKTTANVLRNSSAVSVPSTVCADGTAVTACVATGLAKDTGYQGGYDVVTNMWLIPEYNSKRIAQFSADGTGTVGTYATLSRAFSRFDINRSSDLSTNYIYTCATDGKLYKYDLNNSGAETLLAFPNSTFACSGGLRFDKFRNSLLFTYTQNGLSGVAEYVNP